MSEQLRKSGEVWMLGSESLARNLAVVAMNALGMDANTDWRQRDAVVSAIVPRIDAVMKSAIDGSVYALACESMARQIIHPRMTGKELAERQLKGSAE